MIGTVCYIADFDTENYLNDFKVEASELFHVGVTGGNIPRHISLGMPYDVPDWKAYVDYITKYSEHLSPVVVKAEEMLTASFPTPDTGAFVMRFSENFGLDDIRLDLREKLKRNLGITIEDSLIGKRMIALGCGTTGIEPYNHYVASVDPLRYRGRNLRFDQIGIFYYPSRNWDPSTYICYRKIKLS